MDWNTREKVLEYFIDFVIREIVEIKNVISWADARHHPKTAMNKIRQIVVARQSVAIYARDVLMEQSLQLQRVSRRLRRRRRSQGVQLWCLVSRRCKLRRGSPRPRRERVNIAERPSRRHPRMLISLGHPYRAGSRVEFEGRESPSSRRPRLRVVDLLLFYRFPLLFCFYLIHNL